MFKPYRIKLFLGFWLLTVNKPNIHAQPPIPSVNYLCWRISGNGLTHDSYLFGTIHIIPKKDFFMPDGVLEALKNCKNLVTEIEMDISKQDKQLLAQRTVLPDGENIQHFTDKDTYKIIHAYLADSLKLMSLKVTIYEKVKPIMLSAVLLQEELGKTKSYEDEFYKIANKKKIRNTGLESVQLQFDALDSIPLNEQAKILAESIVKGEAGAKSFKQLIEIYKRQDINKLYEVIQEEEIGGFESVLLTNRNLSWIPKIEDNMHRESCFFAVGAAHLAGDSGIINQLLLKGYILTPVLK